MKPSAGSKLDLVVDVGQHERAVDAGQCDLVRRPVETAEYPAAAIDRYAFIRDAYLQRRRILVHDGNPPEEEDDDPVMWEDVPPPEL
jgi:ABC-type transporter lipoprotein component MlaA